MTDFRTLKDQARRDLHAVMLIPALYRATPDDEWLEVNVRLLRRSTKIGGIPGLEGATMVDLVPRMIFMRSEVALPTKNAIVSIAEGEAWRVGAADPADGITITCEVAPLPAAQTTELPTP